MTTPAALKGDDRYCGAKKRQGEGNCTRPAGWGTDHAGVGRCKLHGGSTPAQRINAEKVLAEREVQRLRLTAHVPTDAATLLQTEAARTNGELLALDEVVGDDPAEWQVKNRITGVPEINPLVKYRKEIRGHAQTLASNMLKAGVAERHARIEEARLLQAFAATKAALEELQLTPEQQLLFPKLMRKHLAALAQGQLDDQFVHED